MWTTFTNQKLALQPNHVHIWSVNVSAHENRLPIYWEILNDEEKLKALRYKFDKDRNCYVIARSILKKLLSIYLNIRARHIEIKLGDYGKPYIHHSSKINFNISHSNKAILIGFVLNDNFGIDVEYTQRKLNVKRLAKQFFSEEELNALLALDITDRLQGFYNCWTRKEAFIKALGSGLSFPLHQFVVSLNSTDNAMLEKTKWDEKEKYKWVLKTVKHKDNYIGAFAVRGKVSNIKSWIYH